MAKTRMNLFTPFHADYGGGAGAHVECGDRCFRIGRATAWSAGLAVDAGAQPLVPKGSSFSTVQLSTIDSKLSTRPLQL